MAKDVITNLIARDSMSGPLQKIKVSADDAKGALQGTGTTAKTTGDVIKKAGDEGSRSMDKLGDSAKTAEVDMRTLSAGVTLLGAGLTYAGVKAQEQERQMIALKASYGDAASEMIRFAEELDNATIFSDDDIRAGELYFSTLVNNYDVTIDQVQELMRITADLASMRGTSFEDASSRVTSAIRGEAEAAEYLNLTMNQQAIDIEGVTLSMGNREAAQVRYNALLEQSAVYQGTASKIMDSSIGTTANWKDMVDDAAASVGGFIGPVGTLATGLSTLGLGVVGVSGSLSTMRALPGAVAGGFSRMNTAVTGSTRAMSALSVALNPWVLGATAAVAVGYQLWDAYKEGERVINTLSSAYENLGAIQNEMLLDGNAATAEYVNNLSVMMKTVESVADQRHKDLPTYFPDLLGMYDEQKATGFADYRDFLADLQGQMQINEEEAVRLADAQGRLGIAFQDSRIDASALSTEIESLFNRYMTDASYTTDQFILDLETLSLNTAAYRKSAEEAAEATTGLGAAIKLTNTEMQGWLSTILSLNEIDEDDSFITKLLKTLGTSEGDRAKVSSFLSDVKSLYTSMNDVPGPDATHAEWVAWVNEADQGTLEWRLRIAEANSAMAAQSETIDGVTRTQRGLKESIEETTNAAMRAALGIVDYSDVAADLGAITREQADALRDLREEYEQLITDNLDRLLAVAGYGDPLSRWNLAGNATDMSLLAMNTSQAASALDSVYRIAVTNTDAFAKQSESIQKWAEDLIGVQGEYSKLDDLVAAGRISGTSGVFTGDSEYAQAQRAFNDITRENAEIQEHVLTIQAKQAPLIRDQVVAMEDYMQQIADMPAQQQLIALGWMDTATAARAMELQTLAVSAANGELGVEGQATFEAMLNGILATTPELQAMASEWQWLIDNGDGTFSVDWSSVTEGKSEISRLIESIDALIVALGHVPPSVTTTVELVDNASSTLDYITSQLGLLDGKAATTYIRTMYETYGTIPGYVGPTMFTGGYVGEYAAGGLLFRGGELGPEIAHFANGGTALLPRDGYYTAPSGTYISPNNAVSNNYGGITVDFTGAVFHNTSRDEMNAWAREDFLPMIQQGARNFKVGQGVA